MGSFNSSDLEELFRVLKDTNSLTFFAFTTGVMIIIFSCFMIFFVQNKNKVFYHRRDVFFAGTDVPLRVEDRPDNWIIRCFFWKSEQIYTRLGIDALIFLKTNRMFLQLALIFSLLCLIGPLPIHASQDAADKPLFIRTSLSVLNSNVEFLWVHFLLIYAISFICMYRLYVEWNEVIKYRQRNFINDPFRISSLLFSDLGKVRDDGYSHILSEKIRSITGEDKEMVEYNLRNVNLLNEVLHKHNELVKHYRHSQSLSRSETPRLIDEANQIMITDEIALNYEEVLKYTEYANNSLLSSSILALSNVCVAQAFRCTTFSINSVPVRVSILPEPTAIIWTNLELDRKIRFLHNGLINLLTALVIVFCSLPFVLVATITKSITISDRHLVSIESVILKTILIYLVNTLIPVALVNIFLLLQRLIFEYLSTYENHVSLTNAQFSVLRKMCIFNAIDTFFAFTFTTTLIDIFIVFIDKPFDVSIALATSIPVQSNFFIVYVAFQAFIMMPWYLVRGNHFMYKKFISLKLWLLNLCRKVKSVMDKPPKIRPLDSEYVYKYSNIILVFGVGIVFGLLSPLIVLVWIPFFLISHVFFSFEEERTNVNPFSYNGEFWPIVSDCVLAYLMFMQIIMIGMFAVKKFSVLSLLTIPACFITFLFGMRIRTWFYRNFYYPDSDTMHTIRPLSLVELYERCKPYNLKSFIPSQTETTKDIEWKYIHDREVRFLNKHKGF